MSSIGAAYRRLADGELGLREFRPAIDDAIRLLAIPYAGGQSLAFRELAGELPPTWGFSSIDPPGHGWAAGTPLENVDDIADLYERELADMLARDCILIGVSFGGMVAYEIAMRLEHDGVPLKALVLIAAQPPHRRGQYIPLSTLDDPSLVRFLEGLGGFPTEWIDQPEILALFLPPLRADIRAFESYAPSGRISSTPVLAVGAKVDPLCKAEHLDEWDRFCDNVVCQIVPGGHFLVRSRPREAAAAIRDFVEKLDRP